MLKIFFTIISVQLLLLLLSFGVNAQELNLTFLPVSSENSIDSIKAVNIKTSEMSLFYETNSILLTTAITNLKKDSEAIHFYFDKFSRKTMLAYRSKSNKKINLSVCDISGKIILFGRYSITQGLNQFKICLQTPGLYVVTLLSDSFIDSEKIILPNNFSNHSNEIVYEGLIDLSFQEKSVNNESADLYHFYIYSGDMITKIADSPSEAKTYNVEFYKCQDRAGRNYPVVKIGNQWWMAENLFYLPYVYKTTDLSVLNYSYCYVYNYNGYNTRAAKESDNYSTYGVLYNWLAAKEYCPEGWHIPNEEEWLDLVKYIDNQKGPFETSNLVWYDVGKFLKSSHRWKNNQNNTDEYGFSALPGGMITTSGMMFADEGEFKYLEENGIWWSTHSSEMHIATVFYLDSHNSDLFYSDHHKSDGKSVRCIKD